MKRINLTIIGVIILIVGLFINLNASSLVPTNVCYDITRTQIQNIKDISLYGGIIVSIILVLLDVVFNKRNIVLGIFLIGIPILVFFGLEKMTTNIGSNPPICTQSFDCQCEDNSDTCQCKYLGNDNTTVCPITCKKDK